MTINILLYLILLIAGGLLSYKGFIHKNLVKKAGSIQLFFLYILIFIMGLRIGLDRKIIEAIYSIGFKAFIYAISTVLFSVGAVFLTSRYIIRSHPKGEAKNDD
jgi:hypothetical protein